MHQLSNNHIAVEVPDGINEFKLYKYVISGIWIGEANPTGFNAWKAKLPTGYTYTIIGILNEIKIGEVTKMFNSKDGFTAFDDLHSFCRSIGKKPEEVLILKREKS